MLNPANRALVEEVFGPLIADHRVPSDGMVHIAPHALNRLLDAAREEGRQEIVAAVRPLRDRVALWTKGAGESVIKKLTIDLSAIVDADRGDRDVPTVR